MLRALLSKCPALPTPTSQEHLSPTEPLRTGQCTVEGLQILALGSGVLPKSSWGRCYNLRSTCQFHIVTMTFSSLYPVTAADSIKCKNKSLFVDVTVFICDPGVNTVTTTTRDLLHTASVCRTASCYPSHSCGPAKWDACRHVRPTHPSTPPQWCRHGDGSWHQHGHVRWWESVSISTFIVFWMDAKFIVVTPY